MTRMRELTQHERDTAPIEAVLLWEQELDRRRGRKLSRELARIPKLLCDCRKGSARSGENCPECGALVEIDVPEWDGVLGPEAQLFNLKSQVL